MSNELAKMEAEARKAYLLRQLDSLYLGRAEEQALIANLWSVPGIPRTRRSSQQLQTLGNLTSQGPKE
jgi:hypothetical protein